MANDTDRLEPGEGVEYAVGSSAAQLFLAAVEQAFTDADDRRAESIRALRDDPEALGVARELYEAGDDDPMFRWGAIYVASEVAAVGTVEWLKDVAISPLRKLSTEERQLCETDRDSEVLVRVMAVEGLRQIVDSAGREAVYEALTEVIVAQGDPAIRSAAGRTRASRPVGPFADPRDVAQRA